MDTWQEIFASLLRHKLRMLLTAFGVFWGIFMLTVLLGVGKGFENGVYRQFSRSSTNLVTLWGMSTRVPYKGLKPGRWIRLTNADLEAIRQQIPEVQYLNANMGLGGDFAVSYKQKQGSFRVQGVLADFLRIQYREMVKGRFLNVQDLQDNRKVAVIGKRVYDVLFSKVEPLGAYIHIKGVLFQVIGVFDVTGFGSNERATEQIYIPLSTLQRTFNLGERVGSFQIVAEPNVPVPVVESKVKTVLKQRHSVAPEDDRAIGSWDGSEYFRKFQNLFQGIKIFLWIIGTGTLLAGIVGVSNVMLIIVKERTREIGLRKALGATPFSIISLIIQEAVFLTAVSGYSGLVVSVATLEGVTALMAKTGVQNEFFSQPQVDLSLALFALLILIIAGTIAGFIPARAAARINPIEALRSE